MDDCGNIKTSSYSGRPDTLRLVKPRSLGADFTDETVGREFSADAVTPATPAVTPISPKVVHSRRILNLRANSGTSISNNDEVYLVNGLSEYNNERPQVSQTSLEDRITLPEISLQNSLMGASTHLSRSRPPSRSSSSTCDSPPRGLSRISSFASSVDSASPPFGSPRSPSSFPRSTSLKRDLPASPPLGSPRSPSFLSRSPSLKRDSPALGSPRTPAGTPMGMANTFPMFLRTGHYQDPSSSFSQSLPCSPRVNRRLHTSSSKQTGNQRSLDLNELKCRLEDVSLDWDDSRPRSYSDKLMCRRKRPDTPFHKGVSNVRNLEGRGKASSCSDLISVEEIK